MAANQQLEMLDQSTDEDDDAIKSPLQLMYSTVRSYVSAIRDLWTFQTTLGLHDAPDPNSDLISGFVHSLTGKEHNRRREEYVDRGLGTMKDGYEQSDIPKVTQQVWLGSLGMPEPSFRTLVDFLFGNSMLLRLSNRLPMELPDLFVMNLPNEGPQGDGWCLVSVMDQGRSRFLSL